MRKLLLLLAATLALATPVLASDGPDSRSPDPDQCQHSFDATLIAAPDCIHPGLTSYTCSLCGFTYTQQTEPDGRHDYAYQYDAQLASDGQFLSYGTWRCANCGETMDATRDDALYYYGQADLADDTDEAATTTGPDAAPADESVEEDEAEPEPEPKQRADIWIAVSAGALALIAVETVLLIRSLRKNKTTI